MSAASGAAAMDGEERDSTTIHIEVVAVHQRSVGP
jgi:hypothetical protein